MSQLNYQDEAKVILFALDPARIWTHAEADVVATNLARVVTRDHLVGMSDGHHDEHHRKEERWLAEQKAQLERMLLRGHNDAMDMAAAICEQNLYKLAQADLPAFIRGMKRTA